MTQTPLQNSFVAGEVSEHLYQRFDVDKQGRAAAELTNMLVRSQGGATFRPGTKHIDVTKGQAKPVRLIPFQRSASDTLCLEFGDLYVRFLSNGGYVLEASQAITAIDPTDPMRVHTADGYNVGDWIYIVGVEGMTEVNGRLFEITATGTGYVDVDDDATGYGTYTSGGTAARVYEVSTPYFGEDLAGLRYAQSNDVLTLTHQDYKPRELVRNDTTDWTMSVVDFSITTAAPTNVTVVPLKLDDDTNPAQTGVEVVYSVTAVDEDTGQEGLAGETSPTNLPIDWTADLVMDINWDAVAGASYYRIYRRTNGVDGLIGEAVGTNFQDQNYTADNSDAPPTGENPFDVAGKYPRTCTFFQQRRGFASTADVPNGYFFTPTGQYNSFAKSRPLKPDDAIELKLEAQSRNEIMHTVAAEALMMFTTAGEWRLDLGEEGLTTTTAANFKRMSGHGAADVTPIVAPDGVLFVQAGGQTVRHIEYELARDGYVARDITILAEHLFEGRQIVDMTFQSRPHPLAFVVLDNGEMRALTFNPEHQVTAWARFEIDGTVESVAAVREGAYSRVYAAIKRTIGATTRRAIERLTILDEANWKASCHLDAAVTQVDTTAGITGLNLDQVVEADGPFTEVLGLWHLEGETVSALADGYHYRGLVVADGKVTLPVAASVATVGLPYTGRITTLPFSGLIAGRYGQGHRRKAVTAATVSFIKGRELRIGRDGDLDDRHLIYQPTGATPIEPERGMETFTLATGWQVGESITVEFFDPIPTTITSIAPHEEFG